MAARSPRIHSRPHRPAWKAAAAFFVLCPMLMVTGCTDPAMRSSILVFRDATHRLAATYGALMGNANRIEEEQYLTELVVSPQPIDLDRMKGRDLFTEGQIRLRVQAIRSLGSYTGLLAAIAAGEGPRSIEAEANGVADGLKTLDADARALLQSDPAAAGGGIAGPVSAAVSAVGTVLRLVEEHRSRKEIRASVLRSDPAIQALFRAISTESIELYQRQGSALNEQQVVLIHAFDGAARDEGAGAQGSSAMLARLSLAERVQAVRRSLDAYPGADPTAALRSFAKAHNDLIALVRDTDSGRRKRSISDLVASAREFEDEVVPLELNVRTLIHGS